MKKNAWAGIFGHKMLYEYRRRRTILEMRIGPRIQEKDKMVENFLLPYLISSASRIHRAQGRIDAELVERGHASDQLDLMTAVRPSLNQQAPGVQGSLIRRGYHHYQVPS